MLLYDQSNVGKFTRYPLVMPVSLNTGEIASSSFTAQLDDAYDIEIYLRQDVAYEQVRKLGMAMERQSELDLRWAVTQGDKTIASGDSRDYLHIIEQRDSFPARVAKYILNIPDRQSLLGPPTVARGVGQLKCRAGEDYQVRIEVGKGVPELEAGNPEVVVSVNRRYVTRHYQMSRYVRVGGVVASSLAVMVLVYALVRRSASYS